MKNKAAAIEIEKQEKLKAVFLLKIGQFLKDKILLYILYGFIFSYFYNLPVLKYSVKGDNEFRLYDILGVFLLYFYYKYHRVIDVIIKNVLVFKQLRLFLYWSSITLLMSLFFYILYDKLTGFLQVILYLYHFWVFYLSAVFFYVFCLDKKILKTGIYLILIFSIASCIVVALQNLGMIDFLWNEVYRKGYHGFLSGTLGPNKIVLGMTSFFTFCLCLGVLLEKNITINRVVLYVCIIFNIYIIIVSGSRTTYLGLGIVLLYFAIKSPLRFVMVTSLFSFILVVALSANPDLQKNT